MAQYKEHNGWLIVIESPWHKPIDCRTGKRISHAFVASKGKQVVIGYGGVRAAIAKIKTAEVSDEQFLAALGPCGK